MQFRKSAVTGSTCEGRRAILAECRVEDWMLIRTDK